MWKLKRKKKKTPHGRKTEGIQKGRKKRPKKGRKKAIVNDPIGFYCDCHRVD
jgi:hypothetical protein